jgi:ABC-type transporter Mla MlaB component
MATKQQPTGLLSKVARYFGTPASEEAEAGESVQSRTGELEKHALQSLIERKRQDDLVRRREFNHLRKLRTHSWGSSAAGLSGMSNVERTSTFQHSSGFSVEDRASTIKKIDDIEATMVEGWSKNKIAAKKPLTQRPAAPAPTQLTPRANGPAPGIRPPKLTERALPSQQPAMVDMDLDFTAMLSATPLATLANPTPPASKGAPAAVPPATTPAAAQPAAKAAPAAKSASAPAATASRAPATPARAPAAPAQSAPTTPTAAPIVAAAPKTSPPPPRNLTPTPALVEAVLLAEPVENGLQAAAMLFAEGDSAAAEAVLLALIQGSDIGPGEADVLASALFDLYRATGQQDGFDVVAMDYAGRFGRSPAEWFSLPEMLGKSAAAAAAAPPPRPLMMQAQDGVWTCPALLDEAALAKLKTRFPGNAAEWHIDWAQLSTIDAQAAQALADVFKFWTTHPVKLHWSGMDALLRVLESQTPADDNSTNPLWWMIRLDAMCILGEQDPFESLALDYCVVYEVSPPSWKDLPCEYVQELSPSVFMTNPDDPNSILPHEGMDAPALYAKCELSGELLGDRADVLDRLQAAADSSDHVIVSCARLIRIDFTATGNLLNWVSTCQAKGCQVEFDQVPRLVSVFFKMLGLDGHAKVSVRAN